MPGWSGQKTFNINPGCDMAWAIQTAISRHGQKGFEGPLNSRRNCGVIASEIADVGIMAALERNEERYPVDKARGNNLKYSDF